MSEVFKDPVDSLRVRVYRRLRSYRSIDLEFNNKFFQELDRADSVQEILGLVSKYYLAEQTRIYSQNYRVWPELNSMLVETMLECIEFLSPEYMVSSYQKFNWFHSRYIPLLIFRLLLNNKGKVVSTEDIVRFVKLSHRFNANTEKMNIYEYISNLRKYLASKHPKTYKLINYKGVGYILSDYFEEDEL